jgi:antitoxin HicB
MLRYSVTLKRARGRTLVSFPDFPQVHTFGDDEPEALARAVDALETYLMGLIEDREAIPPPLAMRKRETAITLPVLTEPKLKLYELMRSEGIGKAGMARRLNCHLPQIDRLLDLGHASRLDQIELAFLAIGKRLKISLEDAA